MAPHQKDEEIQMVRTYTVQDAPTRAIRPYAEEQSQKIYIVDGTDMLVSPYSLNLVNQDVQN